MSDPCGVRRGAKVLIIGEEAQVHLFHTALDIAHNLFDLVRYDVHVFKEPLNIQQQVKPEMIEVGHILDLETHVSFLHDVISLEKDVLVIVFGKSAKKDIVKNEQTVQIIVMVLVHEKEIRLFKVIFLIVLGYSDILARYLDKIHVTILARHDPCKVNPGVIDPIIQNILAALFQELMQSI
jgi:hypothetical protein